MVKLVDAGRIGWANRPGPKLVVEVDACGYDRPQIRLCPGPVPYNIARGIRGPSSTGPFTYAGPAFDSFGTYSYRSSGGTGPSIGTI